MSRLLIRPSRGLRPPDLRELWGYRGLLYFFVWRDLKVRYKQTVIGVAWVVAQPLAMMLVFLLVFGRPARLDQATPMPYWLFAYCGILPWQLFARALQDGSHCLVVNQRLVAKVYFPRLLIPLACCLAPALDFVVGLVLLLVLMLAHGLMPGWPLLCLPLLLALLLLTALGVSCWLAALHAEYRDVGHAVPFLVQLWFFLTPVVYPGGLIPARFQALYSLNPLVGVVDGVRWSVSGQGPAPGAGLWQSVGMAVLLAVTGLFWFRTRERRFVDSLGSGG